MRFVLGQGGVRDDWDIVCVWTPAMSVADAVTEALAAVNQAEFTDAANMFAEEEALSRVTSSVRPEPDDDRRRAPSSATVVGRRRGRKAASFAVFALIAVLECAEAAAVAA